jgi:uncharacterized membrane protein YagU involved in acid resistance
MMQRIKEYFEREFDEETPQARMHRIRIGIFIGLVGGLVYALVAATVNVLSYPGLHLAVNWLNAFVTWVVVSLALIAAGFIVGWPTEEVKATVGGGITLTFVLLLANTIAYLAHRESSGSYFQVLVSSLPMVGICVLAAMALRQGINKIEAARKEEDNKIRKKRLAMILGLVVLIGIVGGFFSRFDGSAVTMLQALNDRLQSTDITSPSKVRFPENVLSEVQKHYGEEYGLYVRSATSTVGALDVTMDFESGYIITCQIPTTSGSYVFMNICAEGKRLK